MVKIYQFQSCPYCARVRGVLEDLSLQEGKDYELVEASRGTPGRDEVVELGGLSQVPFLVDGGTQMYESSDIIRYLKDKFKNRVA